MELLEKLAILIKHGQMDSTDNKPRLLILGVHLKSEAYPNTLYRLRDIEASGNFDVIEINAPMWDENTQNRHGVSRLRRDLWKAIASHAQVMFRYLRLNNRPERIYIPYPSVFVLFLLSLLPRQLRPRFVIADAFISLYDTIVIDRKLLKKEGVLAWIIKKIEKHAYIFTDKLIVDTQQNADFLCSLFDFNEKKIRVTPLSIDEANYQYSPYKIKKHITRVLFVGTLVPLHGIGTILEAIRILSCRADIHFKIIGDGQDAHLITADLRTPNPQLEWDKKWRPSARIAEEIKNSDICLGIFGGGDKTQRVCPFKIYAYAAIGRAIITGQTRWTDGTKANIPYMPFSTVPVNDAKALAEKIVQIVDNPTLRSELAILSAQFYKTFFERKKTTERLSAFLLED